MVNERAGTRPSTLACAAGQRDNAMVSLVLLQQLREVEYEIYTRCKYLCGLQISLHPQAASLNHTGHSGAATRHSEVLLGITGVLEKIHWHL